MQAQVLRNAFLAIAAAALAVVVCYCLFILANLSTDMHRIAGNLDRLAAVSEDVRRLSDRVVVVDQSAKRLDRMEKYMAYIPSMAKSGNEVLGEVRDTNVKMGLVASSLSRTDDALRDTARGVSDSVTGMRGMHSELVQMRSATDRMASRLPALDRMSGILERTDRQITQTASCVPQISGNIERVGTGFDRMQNLLTDVGAQLASLPEMRDSLDRSTVSISSSLTKLEPLAATLPELTRSIQEMNRTTQQMSRTTEEMSKTIRRAPKQGAIGLAVLTAVGLAK